MGLGYNGRMVKTSSSTAPLPQIKAAGLRTFHARLARWYKTHGRHELPWRQTRDPYAIWLSEVMLQQTQVSTVLARFYHPFLKTFPTVQHLASAPREKVMKAWEGLGYYRRAGFLHEAAKKIILEGGPLPPSPTLTPRVPSGSRSCGAMQTILDFWGSKPGIGRNTAHAITAFAYHQPVAILEANVKRVVARIFALEAPSENQLWVGAESLLNKQQPFDYNQAMMDLGSLICTPRNPDCPACPANAICQGKPNPQAYPTPKVKKKVPLRQLKILVLEDASGKLHLEKRSDALLGGLYGFPQVPATTDLRYPMREMNIAREHWKTAGNVVHIYSHFRLEGEVIHGILRQRMNSPGWYSREEIAQLPLSGIDHKVLALIDKHHTPKKKRVKSPPSRMRD
jgi:A/G-specific adenine glycosylase